MALADFGLRNEEQRRSTGVITDLERGGYAWQMLEEWEEERRKLKVWMMGDR